MQVSEIMSRNVVTCRPHDQGAHAARLMWEHDCGVLPVVDEEERVIGVVTDRDVCMGAYTTGARLEELPVSRSMACNVVSCRPGDRLDEVLDTMARARVRRVPVVDEQHRIVGLLSLNDVLCRIPRIADARARGAITETTLQTLEHICRHREPTTEVAPDESTSAATSPARGRPLRKAPV